VKEPLKIVGLCVLAACGYGIVHDQITARICVEYFTIGHNNPFPTDSPTLLGLAWGVYATWWAGLIMGVALVVAARAGRRERRDARSLVRPVLSLLAVMAGFALAAGVAGFVAARSGGLWLVGHVADAVPRSKHAAFIACNAAHMASYVVGFIGGGIQMAVIYATRKRVTPPR
jgi:hypothetical protein